MAEDGRPVEAQLLAGLALRAAPTHLSEEVSDCPSRRFGREGYRAALLSRSRQRLDRLVTTLADEGVEAEGFTADVTRPDEVVDALAGARSRFGGIDVLEYSPAPHAPGEGMDQVGALEVTPETIQPQFERILYGAVAAARAVLPDMLQRGSGTVLLTTNASASLPLPPLANVGMAGAELKNWAQNLHAVASDRGVYVAHVVLATFIGQGGPETQPDTIADLYWDLHPTRKGPEHLYPPR
ncbi:SDR family NAD(P)-dependent oxidoreductase [Streptomyces sp. MS06]|uniref:SDR family NAD(P)-dependent oxidoreductase n=1 Tax=Streptomyces sp. MS06 TaxID=3385974 RepID=UPI0039A1D426